jgi:hypothetical protein
MLIILTVISKPKEEHIARLQVLWENKFHAERFECSFA